MSKSPKQSAIARVLGESRWRILGELCRNQQTASELATRVKTSANAVRVHLDALEEAGLVQFEVVRRQVGKPTHVYSLTAAAESLLSKAYVPALSALLAAVRTQAKGSPGPLLRKAGIALAENAGATASRPGGIPAAVRILEELGAITTLEQTAGRAVVQTACCPLATLTRHSTDPCLIVESALRLASGMNTRQECLRGDHVRCRFEFTT
jgi:predicted ArsR family transcriptional regulator